MRPHNFKRIIFIIVLSFFGFSCEQNQHYKNAVYIDLYGDFKKQATLKIDGNIIYDKKNYRNKKIDLDEIRGPVYFDKEKIKIDFAIDGKDTSFYYTLKKINYVSVGYSNYRHEFQFMLSDSAQFFMPRI